MLFRGDYVVNGDADAQLKCELLRDVTKSNVYALFIFQHGSCRITVEYWVTRTSRFVYHSRAIKYDEYGAAIYASYSEFSPRLGMHDRLSRGVLKPRGGFVRIYDARQVLRQEWRFDARKILADISALVQTA